MLDGLIAFRTNQRALVLGSKDCRNQFSTVGNTEKLLTSEIDASPGRSTVRGLLAEFLHSEWAGRSCSMRDLLASCKGILQLLQQLIHFLGFTIGVDEQEKTGVVVADG